MLLPLADVAAAGCHSLHHTMYTLHDKYTIVRSVVDYTHIGYIYIYIL